GTYSATEAMADSMAFDLGVRVHVIDSRSIAMGLGFIASAAAMSAANGGGAGGRGPAARAAGGGGPGFFLVRPLARLRRGGRLSASQSLVGSALAIKPILEVNDGEVVAKEKVRTASRALARLEQIVVATAAGRPVRLAVHHLAAPDAAAGLASRLGE